MALYTETGHHVWDTLVKGMNTLWKDVLCLSLYPWGDISSAFHLLPAEGLTSRCSTWIFASWWR